MGQRVAGHERHHARMIAAARTGPCSGRLPGAEHDERRARRPARGDLRPEADAELRRRADDDARVRGLAPAAATMRATRLAVPATSTSAGTSRSVTWRSTASVRPSPAAPRPRARPRRPTATGSRGRRAGCLAGDATSAAAGRNSPGCTAGQTRVAGGASVCGGWPAVPADKTWGAGRAALPGSATRRRGRLKRLSCARRTAATWPRRGDEAARASARREDRVPARAPRTGRAGRTAAPDRGPRRKATLGSGPSVARTR